MRTRIALFAVAALSLGSALATAAQQAEPAAPNPLMVTIDTAKTAEPVSKYEFGMFIEHIGPLIYRSLWSEMLDDRKFYFPITSKESAAPAAPQGGFRRNQLRKWRPVGPDEAVVMDKDKPFTGEQSPRIATRLRNSARHRANRAGRAQGEEVYRPDLSSRHSRQQGQGRADLGRRRRRSTDASRLEHSAASTRSSRSASLSMPIAITQLSK